MTSLSQLTSAAAVSEQVRCDPATAAEYDRTAVAHTLARHVIAYRAEHGLTQTALARQLGMKQPALARLEAGDHEPSLSTLVRLAAGLGHRFHLDITAGAVELQPAG